MLDMRAPAPGLLRKRQRGQAATSRGGDNDFVEETGTTKGSRP